MKYYYLYDLLEQEPRNAKYLPNKLALYDNYDSAKRGCTYLNRYLKRLVGTEDRIEIREIEIK